MSRERQYLRHDAAQMENFGIQISQICHDENEYRFDDSDIFGETSNEASQKSPNDSCEMSSDLLFSPSKLHRAPDSNQPMIVLPTETRRNSQVPAPTSIKPMSNTSNSLNASHMWYSTTVTASFSNDSPNTTMYKISLTWISSKTANTATGSTAAISDENRNMSRIGMFLPKMFSKLQAYKEEPGEDDMFEDDLR